MLSVHGGAGGSPTTHYALTSSSLQSNGLEALLERNRSAEQLLDTATGKRQSHAASATAATVHLCETATTCQLWPQPPTAVAQRCHSPGRPWAQWAAEPSPAHPPAQHLRASRPRHMRRSRC